MSIAQTQKRSRRLSLAALLASAVAATLVVAGGCPKTAVGLLILSCGFTLLRRRRNARGSTVGKTELLTSLCRCAAIQYHQWSKDMPYSSRESREFLQGLVKLRGQALGGSATPAVVSFGHWIPVSGRRIDIRESDEAVQEQLQTLPPPELCVRVGRGLLGMVDPRQGARLQTRCKELRQKLKERGWTMPGIQFQDDLCLPDHGFRVSIRSHQVMEKQVYPEGTLAIGSRRALERLGLECHQDWGCQWVPECRSQATTGLLAIDPKTFVVAELERLCWTEIDQLLHRDHAARMIEDYDLPTDQARKLFVDLLRQGEELRPLTSLLTLAEGRFKQGYPVEAVAREASTRRNSGQIHQPELLAAYLFARGPIYTDFFRFYTARHVLSPDDLTKLNQQLLCLRVADEETLTGLKRQARRLGWPDETQLSFIIQNLIRGNPPPQEVNPTLKLALLLRMLPTSVSSQVSRDVLDSLRLGERATLAQALAELPLKRRADVYEDELFAVRDFLSACEALNAAPTYDVHAEAERLARGFPDLTGALVRYRWLHEPACRLRYQRAAVETPRRLGRLLVRFWSVQSQPTWLSGLKKAAVLSQAVGTSSMRTWLTGAPLPGGSVEEHRERVLHEFVCLMRATYGELPVVKPA